MTLHPWNPPVSGGADFTVRRSSCRLPQSAPNTVTGLDPRPTEASVTVTRWCRASMRGVHREVAVRARAVLYSPAGTAGTHRWGRGRSHRRSVLLVPAADVAAFLSGCASATQASPALTTNRPVSADSAYRFEPASTIKVSTCSTRALVASSLPSRPGGAGSGSTSACLELAADPRLRAEIAGRLETL